MRFTMSINVICCVGIRSSLPKRRYRVVVDYVLGDLLRHTAARQDAGCFVGYDTRAMTRVRIWENTELYVGFRGCCE
jgi:hypothetical protein